MRSLPLEFTSDPEARRISDQFMFGPSLLINPVVTEGAKTRALYLPAGQNWIDFWTGKNLVGGRTITADAPLDKMPIYVKAGSILSFGPAVESASVKSDHNNFRIYPGANGDFTLYEDEGDNYDYEHGASSSIPMHWDDKSETLTIGDRQGNFPGMLDHRTFRFSRVTDGRAAGMTTAEEFDATVVYEGKAMSVRVPLYRN
jgi:alpha-D-xyloside xylohydrolase